MAITPASQWKGGPSRPHLGEHQVHVWRAPLDWPAEIHQGLLATLDLPEQERAARFATERLTRRFVAARGILRRLLSLYLVRDPGAIEFAYGDHDKPYLGGVDSSCDLEFNVSHSHDLAVFGFARGQAIGVDIEWIRDDLAQGDIASRFFSDVESRQLAVLSPPDRIEHFFALWTCKEAFVKAMGAGVSFGLDRFDVRLEPDGSFAEIVCNRPQQTFEPWFAYRFDPGPGFAGALAVAQRDSEIALWDWPG